jgi:hypothetical protein
MEKKIKFFLIFLCFAIVISGFVLLSQERLSVFSLFQTQTPALNDKLVQNSDNETPIKNQTELSPGNITTKIVQTQKNAIKSSSTNSSDIIEKNYVTVDSARNNALVAFAQLMYLESMGPGVIQRTGIQFYPEPTIIFDGNGKLLFYEFYAGLPDSKSLVIDTSASKVLGSTVTRAGENAKAPADLESIANQAQNIVDSHYSGYLIDQAKYVCYAYPLVGLEIRLSNTTTSEQKRIFLTQWGIENDRIIQSYYDRIPRDEYSKRLDEWEQNNNANLMIINKSKNAGIDLSSSYSDENDKKMKTIFL